MRNNFNLRCPDCFFSRFPHFLFRISSFEIRISRQSFWFGFAGLGKRALPYCALHVGSRVGHRGGAGRSCRVRVRGTRRGVETLDPGGTRIPALPPIGRATSFSCSSSGPLRRSGSNWSCTRRGASSPSAASVSKCARTRGDSAGVLFQTSDRRLRPRVGLRTSSAARIS